MQSSSTGCALDWRVQRQQAEEPLHQLEAECLAGGSKQRWEAVHAHVHHAHHRLHISGTACNPTPEGHSTIHAVDRLEPKRHGMCTWHACLCTSSGQTGQHDTQRTNAPWSDSR